MTTKTDPFNQRMASRIELWSLDRLRPYAGNARTHNEAQIDQIAASITEFGFNNPILVDSKDGIVAGHGRLLAAQKLGLLQVPVVVLDHLTDTQRRAYVIADNKLAELAGWDEDLLASEVAALAADDFDLSLVGFTDHEITALLDWDNAEQVEAVDEVPEVPVTPVSRLGDLWLLGRHRLICGDSGEAEILVQLMDGQTATLFATDPPYGVGYDGTNHPQNQQAKALGHPAGSQNRDWSDDYEDLDAWDHFADQQEFAGFLETIFSNAMPHVSDDCAWYCWHASATSEIFRDVWRKVGVRYHQTITWVKPTFVLGFAMWNYRSEPCLMGWQQGHKPRANTIHDEMSNVWEVDWEGKARCTDGQHPTQKPVRLFELPMLKHSRPGDVCLETFAGSGSQIIAAERLNRRCFAAERNPRFCDVIVQRWQETTSGEAILEGDGRTYAAVRAERLPDE